METRNLTCIGCPMGCSLTVTLQDGTPTNITGNTCKKGDEYARKEVTDPRRIVTSTMRVLDGAAPVVSCKTASDIPKGMIFEVVEAIAHCSPAAPISLGEVLLADVCGTGVNIVATKSVAKRA